MKFIAHRGFSSKYEENSKKAFQKAYKHRVNMIEADIRLTNDNVWVISHDPTLNRLRQIKQWIKDLPTGFLQKKGILTLNDFFTILKSGVEVYLDIKGTPNFAQLQDLLYILYKSGWQLKKFYLASFNHDIVNDLITVRNTFPNVGEISKHNHFRLGLIGHPSYILRNTETYDNTLVTELDFTSLYYDDLNDNYLQKLRTNFPNLEIYVFTLNDLFTLKHFQPLVDGLISDKCQLFAKLD